MQELQYKIGNAATGTTRQAAAGGNPRATSAKAESNQEYGAISAQGAMRNRQYLTNSTGSGQKQGGARPQSCGLKQAK